MNTIGSYLCSCDLGYRLASDGRTCNGNLNLQVNGNDYLLQSCIADINECAEGTDGCAQMCTNEIGRHSCSCGAGYRLASNGRGCLDINECAEGTDSCDQTCTNTIGSYTCSCGSGYRLASDMQMCNGESVY